VDQAQRDRHWVGIARLPVPGRDDTLPIAFRPAIRDRRLVGILLGAPAPAIDGEELVIGERGVQPVQPGRLVGLQGDRMVLVSVEEIRYAEADGSNVWLHTDRG